jgi:hypothetical protein
VILYSPTTRPGRKQIQSIKKWKKRKQLRNPKLVTSRNRSVGSDMGAAGGRLFFTNLAIKGASNIYKALYIFKAPLVAGLDIGCAPLVTVTPETSMWCWIIWRGWVPMELKSLMGTSYHSSTTRNMEIPLKFLINR